MKQYFLKTVCVASLAVLALPSFAQKEKEQKEREIREKKSEDLQQIIITRKGTNADKTIIEIVGDKVMVNGKDVKDSDNKDVTVHVNKLKNFNALARVRTPSAGTYNFNMDDEHLSLFSEDENRAMLGVVTDEDDRGAKITSVTKESAAEKAGLKSGDIITKIDNDKIDDAGDVTTAVRKRKPGDKISLTILRDGKEQRMTTELGKWKGVRFEAFNAPTAISPEIYRSFTPAQPGQGFNFRNNNVASMYGNTPKLGLSVQDTDDGKGVKVLDADEDGNAAKAGIREDDIITAINDKEVSSTDEISRMVRENKDKSSIKVKLLRNGKAQTIDVRMPRKLKTTDL